MPLYRVDIDTEESATVQYVFEISEDLAPGMRKHPRFGYPSLTLTPEHPLLVRPLHGPGAEHSDTITDPPTCRCGVFDNKIPPIERDQSGNMLESGNYDDEGKPAPKHEYMHIRDLNHLLDIVEQQQGHNITTVELHQLPEAEPRRQWRTS